MPATAEASAGPRPRPPSASKALALSVGLVLPAVLSACGPHHQPKAAPTPAPGQDIAQQARPVRTGHLLLTAVAGQCGVSALSGTHTFLEAHGQFCRLRVRAESADPTSHPFSPFAQKLVLADGTEVDPSSGGMYVRRQPDSVMLGAEDVVELIVVWDIPLNASVRGVRLVGDHDQDAPGQLVVPAVNTHGVIVPLVGLTGPPATPSAAAG